MQLPRLRWVLDGQRWSDWAWLAIGVALWVVGLCLVLYAVLVALGIFRTMSRRHAGTYEVLAFIVGLAMAQLGIVECVDAIARMRGTR